MLQVDAKVKAGCRRGNSWLMGLLRSPPSRVFKSPTIENWISPWQFNRKREKRMNGRVAREMSAVPHAITHPKNFLNRNLGSYCAERPFVRFQQCVFHGQGPDNNTWSSENNECSGLKQTGYVFLAPSQRLHLLFIIRHSLLSYHLPNWNVLLVSVCT